MNLIKYSKYLSYLLRHRPEVANLNMDKQGWVSVAEIMHAMQKKASHFTFQTLEEVVRTNNKKRFAFNADKTKIRAHQGHSINIDLALPECCPPDILFHGTAVHSLPSIKKQGLKPQKRDHVHLSPDKETAYNVGIRHGQAVILLVDSQALYAAGHKFYHTENNVWLTAHIPPEYIQEE